MSEGGLAMEQARAGAEVSNCEGQLRRAQEEARQAAETLRRAIRRTDEADSALAEATRRLDRISAISIHREINGQKHRRHQGVHGGDAA
jgi:C4-type Zn-finger protein